MIQFEVCNTPVGNYLDLQNTVNYCSDPLNELVLYNLYNSNIEYLDINYKGQYPKFCKQIVYNTCEEVIFSIVDNNIYDIDGNAFINSISLKPFLLHDLGNNDDNDINRFQENFRLSPEISIVPIPVDPANPYDCEYRFYIFYSIEKYGNNSLWSMPAGKEANYDAKLFVRTLTYNFDNTINMSDPEMLFRAETYYNSTALGATSMSSGITEFNEFLNEYIFLFQTNNNLIIYNVTHDINDISMENSKVYVVNHPNYPTSPPPGDMTRFPELEIVKSHSPGYYLAAFTQYQKEFVTLQIPDDFSSILDPQYGSGSIINQNISSFNGYNYVIDNSSVPNVSYECGFVGLEFTADGYYLYLTQEQFTGIKCYDMSTNLMYYWEPTPLDNNNFSGSMIELGKDNIMYFADHIDFLENPATTIEWGTGIIYTLTDPQIPGIPGSGSVLNNSNLSTTNTPAAGSHGHFESSSVSRYLFPDQVDGYNFKEFYEDLGLVCCVDFPTNLNPIENWSPGCGNNPWDDIDGHVYFCNDITVPEGINITITDMVFHFADDVVLNMTAGNSISNGARINLYNTTFTNYQACDYDYMWGGVRLNGSGVAQGNPGNSQEPFININDNSTIENARIGVYAKSGGIVKGEDGIFLNNKVSVLNAFFQNTLVANTSTLIDDKSGFIDCSFGVNDDYLGIGTDYFLCHLRLYVVDGISFDHCIFENLVSNKIYAENKNFGIYTHNSGFYVDGNCSTGSIENCLETDLSKFYGFNYGIKAGSSNKAIKIEESLFDNNIYGIEISAISNPYVVRNKFKLGDCDITGFNFEVVGINLIKSTGYRVEENYSIQNSVYNYPSVGVLVHDSGDENNEIYKNDFENIVYGINPVGKNRSFGTYQSSGLEILCNDFITLTKKDIEVSDGVNQPIHGIRERQGFNGPIAAGNKFSQNLSVILAHIDNWTNPLIDYSYYDDLDIAYYPREDLGKVFGNVVLSYSDDFENDCPSKIDMGHTLPMDPIKYASISSAYNTSKTNYYNVLYNYIEAIDAGDTPLLLQQIQETWPQEAWDLRNELISISPFVSRESLEEAANSGILPDAMLLEICLANPDATKDEGFLDFLSTIPNPLPVYMIEMIRDNWDTETSRTILENELASLVHDRDYYLNLLIMHEKMKDERDFTTLRTYYLERDYLFDRYLLAETYMNENEYVESGDILDAIPLEFELNDYDISEYNNFISFHSLMEDLYNTSRTIFDLNPTEIITVQQIADDMTGWSSYKAQNLLCFAYELCIDYPSKVTNTVIPKSSQVYFPESLNFAAEYSKVNVSPVPANEFVEFNWNIPLLEKDALIEVFDVSGNLILTYVINKETGTHIWDTRMIISGYYLFKVKSKDENIANGKIVIQH